MQCRVFPLYTIFYSHCAGQDRHTDGACIKSTQRTMGLMMRVSGVVRFAILHSERMRQLSEPLDVSLSHAAFNSPARGRASLSIQAVSVCPAHARAQMFSNRGRTEMLPIDAERPLPTKPRRFSHIRQLGACRGFTLCLNCKATRIWTFSGALKCSSVAHHGARFVHMQQ
jgi:hypothetical protein